MVGALLGAADAGIYTVAMRSADFVSFPLLVANTIIAPILAAAHQNGERVAMQRLLRISSRLTLLVAMPIALVAILFGSELLGWVFGPSFSAGAQVLAILAGAQVLNVAFGSVGLVLNMCNLEWLAALGVGLAAMLNIALNIALIPRLGIEGAALASLISLVCWNALLWRWVRRRLHVTPSAVGR
jgi:O-antigen/teichoic acid export membrane protein